MIEARRTDKKRRPKPPPRSRVTRLVFVRGGGYLDVVLDRNHALDALGDRGGAIGLVLAAGGARQLHDAVVSLNLDMGRADALFLGEFPLDLGGDRRVGNGLFGICRMGGRLRALRRLVRLRGLVGTPRCGGPRRDQAAGHDTGNGDMRFHMITPFGSSRGWGSPFRVGRRRVVRAYWRAHHGIEPYQVSAATDFRDTGELLTRLSDNA